MFSKKLSVSFALLLFFISGTTMADSNHPRVKLKTQVGEIILQLNKEKAPLTVANFIKHVESKSFVGARFYRVVTPDNQPNNTTKIEVIQGGIDSGAEKFFPIPLETTAVTGLRHLDGVISMARDEPNTATTEFFICVGDQPELDFGGKRNSDGQGFAAFGEVISGKDVVKAIQMSKEKAQFLVSPIEILDISVVQD